MQFKSTLSRLIAFALFMLSASMLACAAPAPAALAVAELGEPSNALVARGDVSDQCYKALSDLKVNIDVCIVDLSKRYLTLIFRYL
jgi:hypothetical protein